MRSLHLRTHVDPQGKLTLCMPPEVAGLVVDLVIVFEPITGVATNEQPAISGWPPGFFEATAGAWQGEPLTRSTEGSYEERDALK